MKLTDEQIRLIAESTPEDWAAAASDCAHDPKFWQEVLQSAVEGFVRGFTDAMNE